MSAPDPTYRPRPTRRVRRTKAAMELIRAHLYDVLTRSDSSMTVRQVFYQMVAREVIAKTEGEYKNTIVRLLTEMRLDGTIPYGRIADNTRWMRKPTTYGSMEAALENTVQTYRRQVWANQGAYVEVWLEKEALAGVVYDLTSEWDVPLMVTRGYPSITFLHEAAEAMDAAAGVSQLARAAKGCDRIFGEIGDVLDAVMLDGSKEVFVYYFGDHDPSGVDIPRNVEHRLNEFATARINFERVAVTPYQVAAWNLPTRPTKGTDSRARDWQGGSVELDAIPVDLLRALVSGCIEGHVDQSQLNLLRTVEAEERAVLERLTSREFVDLARNGNGDG
jgi:hypothetical protein